MRNVGLYFIINDSCTKQGVIADVNAAIRAGYRVIHYSEKKLRKREIVENAYIIAALCKRNNVFFIIEDHADVAALVGADGVHLSQPDFSIAHVRRIIGDEKYIGVQYASLRQTLLAEEEGANYVSIAPESEERTMKAVITIAKKIKERLTLPIIAVGRYTPEQMLSLFTVGIDGIGVSPQSFDIFTEPLMHLQSSKPAVSQAL